MVETEFAAVSIVLLVSFRCFDGSGGFVPVFRWFRPFWWFRFGFSGFKQPFPGSPLSLNVSVSEIMARLRFVFFYFKICYPSQFSLALQFSKLCFRNFR